MFYNLNYANNCISNVLILHFARSILTYIVNKYGIYMMLCRYGVSRVQECIFDYDWNELKGPEKDIATHVSDPELYVLQLCWYHRVDLTRKWYILTGIHLTRVTTKRYV